MWSKLNPEGNATIWLVLYYLGYFSDAHKDQTQQRVIGILHFAIVQITGEGFGYLHGFEEQTAHIMTGGFRDTDGMLETAPRSLHTRARPFCPQDVLRHGGDHPL